MQHYYYKDGDGPVQDLLDGDVGGGFGNLWNTLSEGLSRAEEVEEKPLDDDKPQPPTDHEDRELCDRAVALGLPAEGFLGVVPPPITPRRSGSTRRERLEAKLEKRQEWAEGRREKAAGLEKSVEKYHGDYAFNTQPGHIPERARVIRRQDQAIEHSQMADHHEERAASLERQLERTIFSDDPDAVEALEARIATLEAEADRKTAWNKLWKKGAKGATPAERLEGGASSMRAGGCSETIIKAARCSMELGYSWVKAPFDLTHLRAEIRRNRARIEEVKRGQARQAEVDAAPGGLVITRHEGAGLAVVRFAEKPDRDVLEALRAAEYRYGAGAWVGKLDRLPAAVLELEAASR